MNKRTTFGVVLRGCSGCETIYCERRSTADRIRREVRAHLARGGWSGAQTLRAIADKAILRLPIFPDPKGE